VTGFWLAFLIVGLLVVVVSVGLFWGALRFVFGGKAERRRNREARARLDRLGEP
jgi:hypothetical protein